MKFLMLLLSLSFVGCTIHARPHRLVGPSVVIDSGVDVEVRRRGGCRTVRQKKCRYNRYGHKVCRITRIKKCR